MPFAVQFFCILAIIVLYISFLIEEDPTIGDVACAVIVGFKSVIALADQCLNSVNAIVSEGDFDNSVDTISHFTISPAKVQ